MRPIDPRDPFSTPPAPVYTGEEAYEVRPLPRPAPRRRRASRGRLATFGLAVISGLWVLALAASQATSPTVAEPFLERTIGALGDVPALLDLHEQPIRIAANQPGSGPVAVPGWPVPGVMLPRALAQTGTRDEWRAALLRESAEHAYERGSAVFAGSGEAARGGVFSTSRWVDIVMGGLSSGAHETASLVAWAIGLATLALAALVLVTVDGVRRFVAIGLALIGGAILAGAGGLLGLLLATLLSMGEGGVFVAEVGALIRTIAWAPLQDAVRMGIAGLLIAAPAAVFAARLARGEDVRDDRAEDAPLA
jgi:hypothetical protein